MLLISTDSLWRTRWEVVVMAAGRNRRQPLRALPDDLPLHQARLLLLLQPR
jgi:hypothetical protein